jgi:hypothetical protein
VRLSFDTDKDTLDGALAVLSAAYGVSLTKGTSTAAPRAARTAAGPRTRKAAARKTTARKTSARKATTRKTSASAPARKRATKRPASRGGAPRTADVRAWAAGQGVKVSDRGRLSADLIAKYTAANS